MKNDSVARLVSALTGMLLLLLLAACATTPLEDMEHERFSNPFQGYGQMTVEAGPAGKSMPMRVFYARPARVTAQTPVIFVMHGARRDADVYRDIWGRLAEQNGILIVAPEFSEALFPTGWGYQAGNWVAADSSSEESSDNTRLPPEQSAFAALERVFDGVREAFGLDATAYDIFGHGAGAQFVHRMILLWPEARVRTAIAANAGTYTMPDRGLPLRYGIRDTGVSDDDLRKSFSQRLVIMLGGSDNNPNHGILNKTPLAMAQGRHRVARGEMFMEVSSAAARELQADFRWEARMVMGVGHNAQQMSMAAARMLAGEQ